jgi:hypothetical protein
LLNWGRVSLAFCYVLCGCAGLPSAETEYFLWQGKPGEAARHFGSADLAQVALDKAVEACSFEIRLTASGDVGSETSLSKACMAEKGWLPGR